MQNRGIDQAYTIPSPLLSTVMASPCAIGNCSTSCFYYPNCIDLPPLPPFPPLPPIQPNYSFDNNRDNNNQQTAAIVATLITTVFVLIVLAIIRCSCRRDAHHDDVPLHPTPSTLARSTIITIQTTNHENNTDDNDDTAHYACQVRTGGLDDHIIKSIASSIYNGTSGHGNTECCSVCLGEFHDGEEVKLLHSCGHLFHALCIDMWLKSHVNCPLCRKTVIKGSDHSDPQADSVGAIHSVSGFGSSSSTSMDKDDDMMPSRI